MQGLLVLSMLKHSNSLRETFLFDKELNLCPTATEGLFSAISRMV